MLRKLLTLLISLGFTINIYGNPLVKLPAGCTFLNKGHPLSRGLVGCWLFNDHPGATGKTYDLSGNGNHGTLVNDAVSAVGKWGNCLDFSANDDAVMTFPSTTFADGEPFTAMCWYNVAALVDDKVFWGGTGIGCRLELRFTSGTIRYGDDGGTVTELSGVAVAGGWHHVAFVQNNDVLYAYKDGALANSGAANAAYSFAQFGNSVLGQAGNDGWQGQLDVFVIYNRALTAGEVASLYTDPFQMFDTGMEITYLGSVGAAAPAAAGAVPQILILE